MIHGIVVYGAVERQAAVGPYPADGGEDDEHREETDGLGDGVFDRHPVGLDGAGRGSGVHALELGVGGDVRRRGLCRRELALPAEAGGLRAARVGRHGARVLERRVVERGVVEGHGLLTLQCQGVAAVCCESTIPERSVAPAGIWPSDGRDYAEGVPRRSPLVIGHRGAPGYRPEHSRSSYDLALEMGVDAVEPDIVVSKDGVLVVRHENEISATTDVADRPEFADRRTTKTVDGAAMTGWFTEDFTWDELATLRCRERLPKIRPASASFDDQQPVLRLTDVLDIVRAGVARAGTRDRRGARDQARDLFRRHRARLPAAHRGRAAPRRVGRGRAGRSSSRRSSRPC